MKLSRLIDGLKADQRNPVLEITGAQGDPDIISIQYNSRLVKPQGLFTAIKGNAVDGHIFVQDAVKKGAAAVVTEDPAEAPIGVAVIRVKDSRRALANMASEFFGRPTEKLKLAGITGTNGKTTVTYFAEAMLGAAGCKVGIVGTVSSRWPGHEKESSVTTPESLELQEALARMVDAGVTHAIIEVSSHALTQSRPAFCQFDAGVFTNITQDHLDYHKDMESYFQAKRILFDDLLAASAKENKTAVINLDDPQGAVLCREVKTPVLCTGLTEGSSIRSIDVKAGADGLKGVMETPAGELVFESPAVGRHNLYNLMSAAGVGLAFGLSLEEVEMGLNAAVNVPGRLEKVENGLDRHVFVDYAHTPDALENVLEALRRVSKAKIITVFGCGGDRDKGKRPKMGAAAARHSDLVVVTSDNPRSEDPDAIIDDILPGISGEGAQRLNASYCMMCSRKSAFMVEPDRRKAILTAIMSSGPGDMVLIAGKGHETYQVIKNERFAFDDRVEAGKALECLSRNMHSRQEGPLSGRCVCSR
ncbi:UDP-N-acetylmuramoyl-L-alanyl-D-glutamate--2,6-diaminopimelate ligase [Desulfatibacillum aliphaticivorans]|uniref:UDP-N-acetylmuramoyl-L-alanyl-D-glutamate--2, 6-diaminopimelate ligase n=1 Tax=Desulfatibacillum aliphaticivorans TaxID=218208 RepID=UPI00040FDCF9|nr:UDP-N-acetylmuramoyl-L-alanyl-D-glutamate--2,6-diaminopimelate ligase [Desulfatibacillum aliphaticivorans]